MERRERRNIILLDAIQILLSIVTIIVNLGFFVFIRETVHQGIFLGIVFLGSGFCINGIVNIQKEWKSYPKKIPAENSVCLKKTIS